MKEAQIAVNNNQLALALVAVERMLKPKRADKRVVLSVPAGHGKSKVTLAFITWAMLHYQKKRFSLIFHNQALKEDADRELSKLRKYYQEDIKLELFAVDES